MIYLARHGQTDWNLFRRANGVTDTFLNITGLEQAKQLAEELKDVSFDACFCSPLTRARQFCEILYKGQIVFDERLVEIICGEFESMEETPEMMKSAFQASQTGDKGTERMDIFIKRNCDFCNLIAETYKGKNVLIVTHAYNTRAINYFFKGMPKEYNFFERVVENGKVITLEN